MLVTADSVKSIVTANIIQMKDGERLSSEKSSTFTFTFSHLADAFIQSDLQLGST